MVPIGTCRVTPSRVGDLGDDPVGLVADEVQLHHRADERHHDLDLGVAAGLDPLGRGLGDRPHLQGEQARDDEPEPHAAQAEHRVGLVQPLDLGEQPQVGRRPASPRSSASATRTISSARSGRNSCSGGSSSRMVVGQPVHRLEQLEEVLPLQREQRGQRGVARRPGPGQDHPLDQHPAVAEEHVLGPAQPDPLRRRGGAPASRRPRCRRWRAPAAAGPSRRAAAAGRRPGPARRSRRRRRRPRRRGPPRGSARPARARPAWPRGTPRRWSRRSRSRRPRRTTTSPTRPYAVATSTSSSSAPQTQVLPIPRATTAAWEVLPPRLVRIPAAAIMPSRSSGLVSRRTSTTSSPRAGPLHRRGRSRRPPRRPPHPARPPCPRVSSRRSARRVELREHQLRQLRAGDPRQRLVEGDQLLVDELGGDPERRRGRALARPGSAASTACRARP